MRPGINNLVITLVVSNEAHVIVVSNLLHLFITLGNEFCLLLRDDDIIEVERQTCQISHAVTQVLNTIEELASLGETNILDNVGNDVTQRFLRNNFIYIAHLGRNDAIDDDTTNRGLYLMTNLNAVNHVVNHHLHLSVQIALTLIVSNNSLLRTIE